MACKTVPCTSVKCAFVRSHREGKATSFPRDTGLTEVDRVRTVVFLMSVVKRHTQNVIKFHYSVKADPSPMRSLTSNSPKANSPGD